MYWVGLAGWRVISRKSTHRRPPYLLDYNEHEQVVGVEILGISKRAPTLNTRELQFQTV
jgi:hypothetical protein